MEAETQYDEEESGGEKKVGGSAAEQQAQTSVGGLKKKKKVGSTSVGNKAGLGKLKPSKSSSKKTKESKNKKA